MGDNMHTNENTKSEVAQLLAQIQAEYESGMLGFSGLASGTTKHNFITARMERIGQLHHELCEIVGHDQGTALLVHALEDAPDNSEIAI